MNLKIIIIVVISIIVLGGVTIFLLPLNQMCTQIGCSSWISVEMPDVGLDNLVISINGERFDLTTLEESGKMQEGPNPNYIYEGNGKIKFLHVNKNEGKINFYFSPYIEDPYTVVEKIYIKVSQRGSEALLYQLDSFILDYETSQPNGKNCAPTCYNAVIKLEI